MSDSADASGSRTDGWTVALAVMIITDLIIALIMVALTWPRPVPPPSAPSTPTHHGTWPKTIGGSGDDGFGDVVVAPDGSLFVVGYTTSSDGDFAGVAGELAGVVAKISQTGAVVWMKILPGVELNSLALAGDGVVLVGDVSSSGSAYGSARGGADALVIRLDAGGNMVWSKRFGGSGEDHFAGVAVASDGSVFAVGDTKSTDGDFAGRGTSWDAVAVKLTADGDIAWAKSFGGTSDDWFAGVAATSDGVVAVGATSSPDGSFTTEEGVDEPDGVVVSLSGDGDILWAKSIGMSVATCFEAVTVTSNGDLIVAGDTVAYTGDAPVIELTPAGEVVWTRAIDSHGINGALVAVVETLDGSVIAVGYGMPENTTDPLARLIRYAWVVSLTRSGDVMSSVKYGGNGQSNVLNGLALAPDGHLFAAGYTDSTDGDLPSNHSGDNTDAVIARLAPDGALV